MTQMKTSEIKTTELQITQMVKKILDEQEEITQEISLKIGNES